MNIYRSTFLMLVATMMLLLSTNLEFVNNTSWNSLKAVYARNTRNSSWKQKEIIVTMWNSAEPDASTYANIARENYNLIPVNNLVEKLAVADKNGLKGMFGHGLLSPSILRDPIKRQELDNLIDKVRKSKALEAYFIADEPSASQFGDYAELVAYLHKKDPGRLAYINLLPTYANEAQLGVSAHKLDKIRVKYPTHLHGIGLDNKNVIAYLEYLRQFIVTVKPDLISYDHYHLFANGNGQEYFLNLALISQAAKEAKLPFMNIIQAGKFLKDWRLPTAKEVRFQVYTTLAYGGTAISYFTYWGNESEAGLYREGKQSPLAKDVAVINSEIRKLSPALMSLESQSVYHTKPLPLGGEAMQKNSPIKVLSNGEFVVGLFGRKNKTTAFLIVNRNHKNRQNSELKLDIPGKRVQELDRKTGKWVEAGNLSSDRKIRLTLEPGDGRLLRVI